MEEYQLRNFTLFVPEMFVIPHAQALGTGNLSAGKESL
jgi:hypothetical protein